MKTLILILISNFLISLISLVGIVTLLIREKIFKKIIFLLISLSAGVLMGGAFLHLIPEILEKNKDPKIFLYVLVGFILFFFIEKILHWRHCHNGKCSIHSFAYLNLLGEAVHNFIDGLIIAGSFILNTKIGIATSFAVALHEIPQEFGDFGVLVYGGFKKSKALILNFVIALTSIMGGIVGYYSLGYFENSIPLLLSLASGGFIYIAASDLIPELKKEKDITKSLVTFCIFIVGIILMLII